MLHYLVIKVYTKKPHDIVKLGILVGSSRIDNVAVIIN